ncbi:MAG: hypothetical protein E4H27_02395 [Anaerolineales bacterium]|nr:MAG: hypothetical protein E4H27_02395 [Anaerolineales bacterium]
MRRFKRVVYPLALAYMLVLAACQRGAVDESAPQAARETFSQWVMSANASSEYSYPDWASQRVTGAPDVNACADDSRAWASARGNGTEWLLLEYRVAVFATQINIYQTYGRGAVSRITVYGTDDNSEVVWEGEDSTSPCPGILSVPVPEQLYRIFSVRIDLDESRTHYWNQIDSVELVGYR